jgi:hypothetical protein
MVAFQEEETYIETMNENKEERTGFFKRWQQNGSSSHPKAVTIVLAGILVLCLFAAQLLVFVRTGTAKEREKARQNAKQLIQEVSQSGLDQYIGRKPILRFFLHEIQGKVVGYAILAITPTIHSDNSLVYMGKYLNYIEFTKEHKKWDKINYNIFNDTRNYNQTLISSTSQGKIVSQQFYQEGVLSIRSDRKKVKENFVPLEWLDFYSSLAAQTESVEKDGVIFSIPGSDEQGQIVFQECWVKPGGSIPKDIIARYPDGGSVEVRWFGEDHSQDIYYDNEHQLVWQKDTTAAYDSLIRVVSREELEQEFPETGAMLEKWLRVENDEIQI